MCLVTTQKRASVAKQDITVYKILRYGARSKKYSAIYKTFTYKLHELNTVPAITYAGWGSYFSNEDSRKYRYVDGTIFYKKGFHGFTDLETARRHVGRTGYVVVECTIPKGSKVFRNKCNMFVSDNLIVNRQVRNKYKKKTDGQGWW